MEKKMKEIRIRKELAENLYLARAKGNIQKEDCIKRPLLQSWITWLPLTDNKITDINFFKRENISTWECCYIKTEKPLEVKTSYKIKEVKEKEVIDECAQGGGETGSGTGKDVIIDPPPPPDNPLQEIYNCIDTGKTADFRALLKQHINLAIVRQVEKHIESKNKYEFKVPLYETFIEKTNNLKEAFNCCQKLWSLECPYNIKIIEELANKFFKEKDLKDNINDIIDLCKAIVKKEKDQSISEQYTKHCSFIFLAANEKKDLDISEITKKFPAIEKYLEELNKGESSPEIFAYFASSFCDFGGEWKDYKDIFICQMPECLIPNNDFSVFKSAIAACRKYGGDHSSIRKLFSVLEKNHSNQYFINIIKCLDNSSKQQTNLGEIFETVFSPNYNEQNKIPYYKVNMPNSLEEDYSRELVEKWKTKQIKDLSSEQNYLIFKFIIQFLLRSPKKNYDRINSLCNQYKGAKPELLYVLSLLEEANHKYENAQQYLNEACNNNIKIAKWEKNKADIIENRECPDYNDYCVESIYERAKILKDGKEKLYEFFRAAKKGYAPAVKDYIDMFKKYPDWLDDEMKNYSASEREEKDWLDECSDIARKNIEIGHLPPTEDAISEFTEEQLKQWHNNPNVSLIVSERLAELNYIRWYIKKEETMQDKADYDLFCVSAEAKALFSGKSKNFFKNLDINTITEKASAYKESAEKYLRECLREYIKYEDGKYSLKGDKQIATKLYWPVYYLVNLVCDCHKDFAKLLCGKIPPADFEQITLLQSIEPFNADKEVLPLDEYSESVSGDLKSVAKYYAALYSINKESSLAAQSKLGDKVSEAISEKSFCFKAVKKFEEKFSSQINEDTKSHIEKIIENIKERIKNNEK